MTKRKIITVPHKEIKSNEEQEYCPTQSGNYIAYLPEFRIVSEDEIVAEEWKTVPVERGNFGVPNPIMFGGINSTIFLFGYEQAMALAWGYAAISVATYGVKRIEVRVKPYEVWYDIKARMFEEKK